MEKCICKGIKPSLDDLHILFSDVFAENLNLVPGLPYYVTVTACNAADLCTSVTSDGVVVDDSPPVPGRVYDGGPGSGSVNFQSSMLVWIRVSVHFVHEVIKISSQT